VDATNPKWSKNYNMYSYVTKELPSIVNCYFPVDGSKISITGHSMGGHGAMISYLKNPGLYKSVSALAPISSFTTSALSKTAVEGFLDGKGEDYDAVALLKKYDGPKSLLMID